MHSLLSLLATILSFIYAFPLVSAFTFSFAQAPSQCDNLPLTWTGGTPPFQLLIIHLFGTMRNVSIPSSAFSNGQGSFNVPIPIAQKEQIMLMMSDATGLNTGGTTDILTVGASQGGTCNTTDPGILFSYQLPSSLQQCGPFIFGNYVGAVQPVTITAIVPGGDVFAITPPVGPTTFNWQANVPRGTSMVFVMTDSQGRPGGVSDVQTVTSSDDTSCLAANPPASTSSPPTTPTPTPTSTLPPSTTTSSTSVATSETQNITPSPTAVPHDGFSIAAIAGTVIGSLLFLAVVITLGLFCLRNRRDDNGGGGAGGGGPRLRRGVDSSLDLTYDHANGPGIVSPYTLPLSDNHSQIGTPYPYSPGAGTAYTSNPFLDNSQSDRATSHFDPYSMYSDNRYAQSEVDQYEMPLQSQYGGGYQPSPSHTRTYPPPPNSPPLDFSHGSDPFNPNAPPLLPASQYRTSAPLESPSQSTPPQTSNRVSTSTSAAQRKAAAAGVTAYKPSRFILHTDVEDELPVSNEEVIELPPQYSERRGPPPPVGTQQASLPGTHAGHPPVDSQLPYS